MKNIRVFSTVVLAGSLMLALPLASQARPAADHGGHYGHHFTHGKHHGKYRAHAGFMRGLDLSEAQRDQIFKLRHEAAPTLREKGKAVRAARAELRQLGKAAEFDDSKAQALTQQVANAEAAFMLERLRLQQQVYAVLTPEQRAKAAEARERAGKRGHKAHRKAVVKPAQG